MLVKNIGIFEYFRFWHISWTSLWAIFLITVGLLLIYSSKKSQEKGESSDSTSFSLPDINKIYRSKENRMLAGVCAGIATYFNIDPSIVRIIWVIASIGTIGLGILVYILLIFIFPDETEKISE